ncbi:MAG: sulfatase, partial [Gemmobacter sp.]
MSAAVASAAPERPNIVLIYADDIGWGDLGCYGAKVIPTPNIDRLAAQGARFTSGYCTSATSTPSRYSMLTGEYAWRRKGTGVLRGDAALILPGSRPTVATSLRDAGYATAHNGQGLRISKRSAPVENIAPNRVVENCRYIGVGRTNEHETRAAHTRQFFTEGNEARHAAT